VAPCDFFQKTSKTMNFHKLIKRLFYGVPIILLILYLLRRKRIKSRDITINTQALLWNPSLDLQSPNFAFKESAIQFLKRLLKDGWKLYLVSIVKSDEQQESIKGLLQDSNLQKLGLQEHRVLYCSTSEGMVSIVRHIQPSIHLDTNIENIRDLASFIPKCVLLRPNKKIQQVDTISDNMKNVERVNTLTNIVLS
jgi:hypothetical protein